MEPLGVFLDEEWESLSRMLSTDGNDYSLSFWLSSEDNTNKGGNGHGHDQSLLHSSETLSSNFYYFSHQGSNGSGSDYQLSDCKNVQETDSLFEPMDLCMMNMINSSLGVPVFADDIVEGFLCLKEETSSEVAADPGNGMHIKRKFNNPKLDIEAQDDQINANISENPKKKSHVSRDAQKSKKTHEKLIANGNDEEDTNSGPNGQSSSCCSSEDDSNSKGSAVLNLNGKTRATRSSATDPQSLYARKRRESINERLKVLQTLVPNGTKVDISTMLEEAVHYVKFLQHQIKLLSSEDLWMYAPLAYNGLDIGLYQKISPT